MTPEKEYTFLKSYQHDDNKYRFAFNNLAKKIFGISFEEWYQAGYWNDKYIPYTLFHNEIAIANISVNIMNFNLLGQNQRYIQIGTVMTDENYRGRNLSRFLMEKILEDWNERCDLVYLFANSSVLNMYPKFGFSRVKEYEYLKPITASVNNENYEKLNMDLQSNRDMLHDYAKNSKAFSKLSMSENADLVMFYCISFFKDNVYYIQSLDTFVVAKFNNQQFHLFDVFSKKYLELDEIIYSIADQHTSEVLLGFTPKNYDSYEVREVFGDDTLFVQRDKTEIFDKNKLMFPILSHA